MSLDYRQHVPITILIFDDLSGRLLQHAHFNFDKKKHRELNYHVGALKASGIRTFRVEITNNKDKAKEILRFTK